jgi:hypothetical protein
VCFQRVHGVYMTQTKQRRPVAPLNEADAQKLDDLVQTYGTEAQVIRVAIRQLHASWWAALPTSGQAIFHSTRTNGGG